MKNYDHKKIEKKWQKMWEKRHIFKADDKSKKPKFYGLIEFPYPSGDGLHVGHIRSNTAMDAICRKRRMEGHNVLYPIGWDAFGLPTENYAIKTGIHPTVVTKKNTDTFRWQLKSLGFSFDWSREINTTDPKYYKWTQWIFLQLYKHGLAYKKKMPINWCPSCKIGLANEEVIDDKCERCGTQTEKKEKEQWMLAITKYADKLLNSLNEVKIPEFTNAQGSDAFRADMPVSTRRAVYCIIKHWKDDSFLCMKWKKNDWKGYVVGGVEGGESIEETAKREIREETGYKNIIFKKVLGNVVSQFYQEVKKQNRRSHITLVYVELQNGERDQVEDHEKEIQDVEWVPRKDVRNFVNREDLKYMWDLFTGEKEQEELLDWPDSIKMLQKNWIGKSEGSLIRFKLQTTDYPDFVRQRREQNRGSSTPPWRDRDKLQTNIEVFTTRPDTLFGVTYIVLAPEHKIIESLKSRVGNWNDVKKYIESSKNKTEIERTEAEKEKTGVELKGIKAVNPANGEEVPVWIADYVLADYGTGAVMAVPAHDERDLAFQKKYRLGIRRVIRDREQTENLQAYERVSLEAMSKSGFAWTYPGILMNSGKFDGMDSEEAKWKITEAVGGKKIATYRLRDWVFSRQHYWGEPIPMVYCESCAKRKYNFIFIHGYKSTGVGAWRPWLKKELEERGHKVFSPDLPNSNKPSVEEQADFIIKNGKIDKDTIFIGGSLGGAVLLRILEKMKNRIAKAVFVDPVLRPKFNDHPRPEVEKAHNSWKFDFKKIKKNTDEFVVLADANYETIPKDQLDELAQKLDADYIISVPQKRHYTGEKEPEILKLFENRGYVPVTEKDLPVELPKVEKYQPTDTGESPLADIKKWVNTKCPHCGGKARRETDTMPNWAGSSWYYLAYTSQGISNFQFPISNPNKISKYQIKTKKNIDYWTPVNWYNGGMEHTTLHLLYSRFWHKFLFDIGLVPTDEPYQKRTSHGMILAEGGVKMSKSKGNVINPDDLVERFGADSLRVYEMFMGPFDQAITWSTDGLVGTRRFLEKVWRIGEKLIASNKSLVTKKTDKKAEPQTANYKLQTILHRTVKKVGEDIEAMRFNTAISSLMICANNMDLIGFVRKEDFEMYLKILSPFAPHISEELWSNLGNKGLIVEEDWPIFDPAKIVDEEVTIVVQINGKLRGQFFAPRDISEKEAAEKAQKLVEIIPYIQGKQIRKIVYVKGRLISIVI